MALFQRLADFYIRSSLHVAVAVWSLVRMTEYMFDLIPNRPLEIFAFAGTVAGYNFVKYDALARTGTKEPGVQLKLITALSFFCLLICAFVFFMLSFRTQVLCFLFLLLTILYTLPFFPNRKNARNWAGVKIYIVALCWVGVTVALPVVNAEIALTSDFFLKCIQRFILVFVLILIFEIIDLAKDDPHLKTVPQLIGVRATKFLGLILLAVFFSMEFLQRKPDADQLAVNVIMVAVTGIVLWFAHSGRSRYYSVFWAESLPLLWLSLYVGAKLF